MIQVVAGLIAKRGRLLICQRKRGSLFELQWEFPGGKLREGESPEAGLARELREELSCRARIGAELHRTRHYYRAHKKTADVRFFAVSQLNATPRNLIFEKMLWVYPSSLLRYDFLAADRAIVRKLARGQMLVPQTKTASYGKDKRARQNKRVK